MRTLIILSLLLCAVNALRLNELRPLGRLNASPRSECVGIPDGTQIPHPVNCNQFILCENDNGLTLTCRSSNPHFDRCDRRCTDDIAVCMITDCNGGAPTAPPATTTPIIPTAPPETTTMLIPTAPPDEVTTTTTRFVVPTAPGP